MDIQTSTSLLDPMLANKTTSNQLAFNHNGSDTSDDGITEEDWFGFITEGIMLTSISTFGFIGNVLSVWILLRKTLRGNFSNQLTSLAGRFNLNITLHKFHIINKKKLFFDHFKTHKLLVQSFKLYCWNL